MPVIDLKEYVPPVLFRHRHLHTIYTSLFRRVPPITFERRRLDLPDGDFIDLDFSRCGSKSAVLLCHGLEGSSDRNYMIGMAHAFNRNGWDAIGFNFRGCSGETNRLFRAYHSGLTDDLDAAIRSVMKGYSQLALVGFSLGGNLILKYLGEKRARFPAKIKRACVISVPCDLRAAADRMNRPENWLYSKRFLFKLTRKLKQKKRLFPDLVKQFPFHRIKTLQDFDDHHTAPAHGFIDAVDYWTRSSAKQFVRNIKIPVCILNSLDDPLLPMSCHPIEEAKRNRNVTLLLTRYGGHVGFLTKDPTETFAEATAVRFVTEGITSRKESHRDQPANRKSASKN